MKTISALATLMMFVSLNVLAAKKPAATPDPAPEAALQAAQAKPSPAMA